jgi:uncharacterized protein YukE
MQIRTDAHDNSTVAPLASILNEMQKELSRLQEGWSHQLQEDPSRFGQVEGEVHQTFQQLADQVVAGLLGAVGQQPALEEACKKSR